VVVEPGCTENVRIAAQGEQGRWRTQTYIETHRAAGTVEETHPRSLGTSGFGLPPSGRLACALGGREP